MQEITLRNRQRQRRINRPLLARLLRCLIESRLGRRDCELAFHLLSARAMAELNWRHLRHPGSTDVITFPYSDPAGTEPLVGDVFICIDEAVAQAAAFKTTWQSELVRYAVHAVLHLQGHDDLDAARRRTMKRAENRLLRELTSRFSLQSLGRNPRRRFSQSVATQSLRTPVRQIIVARSEARASKAPGGR